MERTKTGVPGLDELIQGGIPQGSSVLLSGGPGTGKSILAMQYIYNGAKDFNEPGLYVTLETNLKNIVWNMESFQMDIKPLQEQKLMTIYRLNLSEASRDMGQVEAQINKELENVIKIAKDMNAKRLVIDSTTAFGIWIGDKATLRSMLYKFGDGLKELNCTTIMTCEVSGNKSELSAFGVEEFLVDGVIRLYFTPPHRSVFVRKLRGTIHSKSIHPFEIKETGVQINARDELMWNAIQQ